MQVIGTTASQCANNMTSNLQIDEALAVGDQQTERDVVEQSLREYVQRRKHCLRY